MADAAPLSLYLHFPWCVSKCPYCDFNSHAVRGATPEAAYVAAMQRDLDLELQWVTARPVQSIFFGGGTPSLMSDAAVAQLLEYAAARLPFAADIEITLEANPGTVDEAHFRGYRRAGVNRLSIGIQSLEDAQLKVLGRAHDAATARRAVATARSAGFDNLNLDLMYALPGQSLAQAGADLQAALALSPEHLSYYQLTLEPNTAFYSHPPVLPDNDAAWAMQLQGVATLEAAGYAQYEVSAYSQPGRACRHNLNYWRYGDYIGIGAGAHGKTTTNGVIERRARTRHPKAYLAQAGTAAAIQSRETVPQADLPFEFAMNALRLNQGFTLLQFEQATGASSAALQPALNTARDRGLLAVPDHGPIQPTPLGRAHLNALMALFLPESAPDTAAQAT